MKKSALFLLLLLSASSSFARSYETGLVFSYGQHIDHKHGNPKDIQGYRAAFWIHPSNFSWGNFDLLFDANVAHWSSDIGTNNHINIVGIAPIARYYLWKKPSISSYIIGSIGPAMMSATRLGGRNFGINYTFQDKIGLGFAFGKKQQYFADLQILHYSNASISRHNQGITVPLLFSSGFQFC